jgi:hypothetical protein
MESISKNNTDLLINLGFAEKPDSKDFNLDKFPSKIGGKPVMLFPIDNKYFICDNCGGKTTFLMQLYSIIDDLPHCYHRTLYVFFCINCFKNFPAFKCIRLQLPEKSEYYNGDKPKDIKQLQSFIPELNSKIILEPEYKIGIEEESENALNLYTKLVDRVYDTFNNKTNNQKDKDLIDELEYDPQLSKSDNEFIKKLMKNYKEIDESQLNDEEKIYDQAEDEFLNKVFDKNGFKIDNDIVFRFFYNIIKENPDQIVRYSRDKIKPLWYCTNNIMKNTSIKCKNCKREKLFEFQIMPEVFMLYDALLNHDIGTICVFTCDCNVQISEEHVYIQRTGEKIIDLNNKEKLYSIPEENVSKKDNNFLFGKNQNNEPDEDGFIEINTKKGKKKVEKNENDSFSDDSK